MRLLTQRALIVEVADRWKRQYQRGDEWKFYRLESAEETYLALAALDPATATAEQVEAIIGNPSWSSYFCSECHQYAPEVIEFDNHEVGCEVCPACVRKAAALIADRSK